MATIRLVSSPKTPGVHENAESHHSLHGIWKFENCVRTSINLSASDMAQFTPKVRDRIYELARGIRKMRGAPAAIKRVK
jgi:hypothetical protein